MSHQPIRVVQPPTTQPGHSRIPRRSHPSSNSIITYDELMQTAEQQRCLIYANRRLIHEHETRMDRVDNAPIRLVVLRNEIQFEEREMARLKMMERETQQIANHRILAEKQLNELQINCATQEQHLRSVISKFTSLQTQLDVLRRRRLIALNAAREQQQRLMSSQKKPACTYSMRTSSLKPAYTTASNVDISSRSDANDGSGSSPLALQHSNDTGMLRPTSANLDCQKSRQFSFDSSYRPRASIEPFQVTQSNSATDVGCELSPSCPQLPNKPRSNVSTFGKARATFNIVDRNSSPPPPKDPYPTNTENSIFEKRIAAKLDERAFDTVNRSNEKLSACEMGEERQNQRSTLIKSANDISGTVESQDELLQSDLVDNAKLTGADQISIRPDTLRAAKRRSWAVQDNTTYSETEYIRKILLDEQKKGRTHLLVGLDIGNLFMTPDKSATGGISEPEMIYDEKKNGVEEVVVAATVPNGHLSDLWKDIQLNELPAVENEMVERCEQGKAWVAKEVTGQSMKNGEMETQKKTSGIAEIIRPLPKKGILCVNKVKKSGRKVVFDPLALLLDAALEGEMDLVEASAAKLSNISACNDEGITALHNAICAGHYEIVRYLVDSFADVNAQDSDGWTPLHCAASCNNLPMVKLLVESGACIFAQTLSDLETPAEKCEEDEDGYEGCKLYLKAADEEAGIVNNGLMYAAYDYDREQEDELSFPVGASLRVLKKEPVDGCTSSSSWWLCEIAGNEEGCDARSSKTSERGLVPRNYLSLYPCLSKRSANFIMFDLSQLPKMDDVKKGNLRNAKESSRNGSLIEGITGESAEGTIVEQTIPISVS